MTTKVYLSESPREADLVQTAYFNSFLGNGTQGMNGVLLKDLVRAYQHMAYNSL